MSRFNNKLCLAALAVSASTMVLSTTSFAQLDEIVVTAQKKEENLQDVPIAIAAFDVKQLETNRIEGLEDIGRIAPGVNITPNSADPNGVQINIRGIGILDPQVGQDSRVAIYQDGIYLGKTQGLAFDMPDMERLEVLKGPQGTLYGRNSVGGAVNLISAAPSTDEFSGKMALEYGSYNHVKGNAAINIPLGDSAAARLSGVYLSRDGWVENLGSGADFGGERKFGLRAAVGVELSESMRVDVAVDHNQVEKEPIFYQSFGPGAQPFAAAIESFDNGRQEETTTSFRNERGDLEATGASLIAKWTPREGDELKATLAYREADSSRFVTLIPTADPNILNAITGGFNQALAPLPFAFGATQTPLRADWSTAFTGNPPEQGLFLSPPGGSRNLIHDQLSLDVTYNGSFGEKLDYTVGGFFYDESTSTGPVIVNPGAANDYLFALTPFAPQLTPLATHQFFGTQIGPNATDTLIPGYTPAAQALSCLTGGATGTCFGPIPASLTLLNFLQTPFGATAFQNLQAVNGITALSLSGARQSASNTLDIETTALALYGQATFHVSDALRITAGLRYSDESKDGMGQSYSPFFNDTTDLLGNPILPNISSYNDSILDPALIVEFDASDDVMLYASYKESFRAGGFNAAAVGLREAGETFGADFNFDREDITSYEVGFKGTFADGKARVNAAAFLNDFTNVQSTIRTDPLIATSRAVANTNQETYGFEIDGLFALTDEITARGSYSYIDGEVDDIFNPFLNVVSERDELQGTPKNQYLASLSYDGSWGDSSLFGNITYSHKDDLLRVPENQTRLSAQDLVSANIGMGFQMGEGGEATITLWGQNLLDDEYIIDALPFETFAHATKVYGQPRSYGVTAAYKF